MFHSETKVIKYCIYSYNLATFIIQEGKKFGPEAKNANERKVCKNTLKAYAQMKCHTTPGILNGSGRAFVPWNLINWWKRHSAYRQLLLQFRTDGFRTCF